MQSMWEKFTMSSKVSVEVFEIIFDKEQAVYREGDTVSGHVKLVLTEEIKLKGNQVFLTLILYTERPSIII